MSTKYIEPEIGGYVRALFTGKWNSYEFEKGVIYEIINKHGTFVTVKGGMVLAVRPNDQYPVECEYIGLDKNNPISTNPEIINEYSIY